MINPAKRRLSEPLKVLEFAAIIVGSAALGLITHYFRTEGVIPRSFAISIYASVMLVGGYLAIRIVTSMLETVVEPRLGVTRTHGIKNFFQIVSGIALVAVIFAVFGFNLTGVLIGAGFLGIVLGLAAQQVLGNVFAGLSMLASRPFSIGDRVTLATSTYGVNGSSYSHETEVNGFTGTVKDIGIFYTEVLLDDGNPSLFPNSVVIGSLVMNHTRITLRKVTARVDLDKQVDYATFKSRLLESLKKYREVDVEKSTVELADVGEKTYQAIIVVWARNILRESMKTLVIQEALKVQREMEDSKKEVRPPLLKR